MWRYSSETDRTPFPGRHVNFACGIACSRETICPPRKSSAISKSPRTPGGPGGALASAPSAELEKAQATERTAAELKRSIDHLPRDSLRRRPYAFGCGLLHAMMPGAKRPGRARLELNIPGLGFLIFVALQQLTQPQRRGANVR